MARGGKETARALERVGVNTAGEDFAGRWRYGVIGAGETGDRVEKDDHVALVLDQTFGLFKDHFGDLDVALRRFVERRADDFAFDGALHVGDFFGALVD